MTKALQRNQIFCIYFCCRSWVDSHMRTRMEWGGGTAVNFPEIEGTEEISTVQEDQINSNYSRKPERIHQSIQRDLKNGTAELLTAVCNLSPKTSLIPEEWRQANTTPNFRRNFWEGWENYSHIR